MWDTVMTLLGSVMAGGVVMQLCSWMAMGYCDDDIVRFCDGCTSWVSLPPTMLRPSPERPLEISMMVSSPGRMGHTVGSVREEKENRVLVV